MSLTVVDIEALRALKNAGDRSGYYDYLAGTGDRSAHESQLPRWIHEMNPSCDLCNRASFRRPAKSAQYLQVMLKFSRFRNLMCGIAMKEQNRPLCQILFN